MNNVDNHELDFHYEACTIRQFDNYVDLIETHGNFVFATDKIAKKLAIFLVDETDLEDDNESIEQNKWEATTDGEVTHIRVTSLKTDPAVNVLTVITADPYEIQTYHFKQTSCNTFEV